MRTLLLFGRAVFIPRPSLLFVVLILSLVLLPAVANGQQSVAIQGKVTDARTGDPLPGANVFIRELNVGSASDRDGNYTFLVPPTSVRGQEVTLVIKFVGYKQKTEKITLDPGVITRNIALDEDVLGLEEVIVTGTIGGTFKEKLPFAVDRITTTDLQHVPTNTPESAIRGKVAGVKIVQGSGQPGTAPAVQMRGATSINTTGRSGGPLYIVDGVILGASTVDLDAMNIESIEVVKGAAASSIYGSRAAAGVVQITTNRGAYLPDGETRITLRNEYGRNELAHKIPLTRAHHFKINPSRLDSPWVNYQGRAVGRASRVPDTLYRISAAGTAVGSAFTSFKDKEYVGKIFDQIDEFFDPGFFYTNNITVAHKSRNTNFLVSFNNRRDAGVIENNDGAKQQTFRANVDHKFLDAVNISLSASHSTLIRDDNNSGFFELTFMPPDVDLRSPNSDGQPYIIWPDPGQSLEANPLYSQAFREVTTTRKRTLGNLTVQYAPMKWFDLEGILSYDRLDRVTSDYYPKGYKTVNASTVNVGTLTKENQGIEALNGSLTASFNYDFGDFSTRTKVRYAFEQSRDRFESGSGNNFAVANVPTLSVTTESKQVASSTSEIKAEGYYFITGVDYQGKYIADFLIRRDGSSLFGVNDRWHTYFRGSAAYRLTQEPWWPIPDINELKLRYSIGTAGSRPSFTAQYETYSVSAGVISKGRLGNKDLRPEISTEQEMGLELGLMNRFLLEFTYARTETKDQILDVPLPGVFGYSSQWKNAGTLLSNTIEASLKAFIIQSRDMSLSATLLFDRTRQEITEFDLPPYRTGPNQQSGNVFYVRKGEVLGAFYGRKWMKSHDELPSWLKNTRDLWQVNDDGYLVPVGTGNSWGDGIKKKLWGTNVVMTGADGKTYTFPWGMPAPYTEEDGNQFVKLGSSIPDFNLAFNTTFRYKGITAYLLFDAQIGGEIYNLTRQWAYRDLMSGENDQLGKSEETKKPLAYYSTLYSTNLTNSHFVEDGTYLKLRELSLRYTFDRNDLAPIFGGWINRITVGIIGRNLVTWTNYKGYDPEVGNSSGGNEATVYRFDGYYYPNYRNYTGTLEIEF
jgi:TonB-linked SusC/RagA family outer membrane protein